MIEKSSILYVADNTPVRSVRCIGAAKRARRSPIQIGDRILVSVRKLRLASFKFRRGQKLRAILVRTRKPKRALSGFYYAFQENRVVLLSEKGLPRANRIKGPLPHELRAKGYAKFFRLGARVM